jgi:alkanesulfonate monooxygenase SsuD/methylene tetrahydromethanopterin reductase-like flavin-dependent oxidoreductase (luciferase family)
VEAAGYDGLWTGETSHEPFLMSMAAAQATTTASIGTSIAIAFARSPMTTANAGYDLAQYSEGRFILGLGSQIKPHIERRFSMPWSHPASRMREYVLAMKAIWSAWHEGTLLNFEGEFYTHTLMTPFFMPEPHEFGPPPVYLAGVGSTMVETVGEVADGYFAHAFTTERYFRSQTLPALRRGRAKVGATDLDGFCVCGTPFASTPAYEAVLAAHGWEALRPELTTMSKQGRWVEMGDLISDEMLEAFSVVGTPTECAAQLVRRWGDVFDRVSLYTPGVSEGDLRAELTGALRAALANSSAVGSPSR